MSLQEFIHKQASQLTFGIDRPAVTVDPFKTGNFKSLRTAWEKGFNENYWTHGIVISQGNGMSVTKDEAVRRLNHIKRHLLRRIFGNQWRKRGKIKFVVFQHGATESGDAHFHAVLGIEGNHEWSNFRIGMTIRSIEFFRHQRAEKPWEKMAHVDWNWNKENRYHGYISRFANERPDDWWIL